MAQLDSISQNIFALGGVTAILLLVYSLTTLVLLMMIGGQPKSAQECFSMLKTNRWKGLLRLDGLTILVLPLYFLLFLALYVALYKTSGSLALVAVVIGFAGVTLVLATPSAFSWLALSDKFEAESNEEPGGLDFVFDGMGGKVGERGLAVLHRGGKLVAYAVPVGLWSMLMDAVKIALNNLLPNGRSIEFYGITALYIRDKRPFMEDLPLLFNLLAEGKIKPITPARFPLLEAKKANELLESGQAAATLSYWPRNYYEP